MASAHDQIGLIMQLRRRGIRDPKVLRAIERVPRELFVDEAFADHAYHDIALPIECGQTISQPFVVAFMTEKLDLNERHKVLEVGTGSGYQAAVLAQCGARVTSVERDEELAAWARENLRRQGYDVEVLVGDGSAGYPANAPYAAIVVGAGAPRVPRPLKEQLADGGRLAIPIGDRRRQRLTVVERRGHTFEERVADPCVFVPLVGQHGHPG